PVIRVEQRSGDCAGRSGGSACSRGCDFGVPGGRRVTAELIRLEQIRAGYGEREPVLLDVHLTVSEGEAVGIVGMNGAGTSSLMKVISGGLRPRAGAIVFAGKNVVRLNTADRARRGIVLLPEGHRVIRPLSVHENLEI